jgi:hypothetical protein
MISLLVVFLMFILLFGIIGGIRGWAKELLVIFSVIVALALISVIENLMPVVSELVKSSPSIQFYFRIIVVLLLSFFGYQTPKLARFARAAERREAIPEMLLGVVFGLFSGFAIVGSLWYFMHSADYPLAPYITRPKPGDTLGEAALQWVNFLAPVWLSKPTNAFIAVVIALIFVIIVFV